MSSHVNSPHLNILTIFPTKYKQYYYSPKFKYLKIWMTQKYINSFYETIEISALRPTLDNDIK